MAVNLQDEVLIAEQILEDETASPGQTRASTVVNDKLLDSVILQRYAVQIVLYVHLREDTSGDSLRVLCIRKNAIAAWGQSQDRGNLQ